MSFIKVRARLLAILFISSLVFTVGLVSAATVEIDIPTYKDAKVYTDSGGGDYNVNYGTSNDLETGGMWASFLGFNLTQIPSEIPVNSITNAEILFTQIDGFTTPGQLMSLFNTTNPVWSETSITGLNNPCGAHSANSNCGFIFYAISNTGESIVSNSTSRLLEVVRDVWRNTTNTDKLISFRFQQNSSASATANQFHSREGAGSNSTKISVLRITYRTNEAPLWSNINNTPTSPVVQSPTRVYIFNTTWTDDLDTNGYNTSIFNSNHSGSFVNYTMFRYDGNTTSINFTGLSAGGFVWWVTANDSSNAYNSTPSQTFLIEPIPTFTTVAIMGGGYYGDTTNTAQQYMAFFGDSMVTTEYSRQSTVLPTNGTIRNLYASKASGGANVTFTLYKNGSATDVRCSIISGDTSCFDLANNATFVTGDTMAIGVNLSAANPTGYFRFTVELVKKN
jgi:hypothetical protein